jgi:hypothetical protein
MSKRLIFLLVLIGIFLVISVRSLALTVDPTLSRSIPEAIRGTDPPDEQNSIPTLFLPDTGSTPTPLIPPTIAQTSLPTRTTTPEPVFTHTPSVQAPKSGIGKGREELERMFETLGFRFKPGGPASGRPRTIGTSEGGLAIVELVGKDEELDSASILVFLVNDNSEESRRNSAYLLSMVQFITPNWEGGNAWLAQEIENSLQSEELVYEAESVYGELRAKLAVTKEMGTVMLSFERANLDNVSRWNG